MNKKQKIRVNTKNTKIGLEVKKIKKQKNNTIIKNLK